ncbi:MAG TPA: AraC family transcriptional regulator [Candidatus Cybelea sp.]
MRSFPPGYYTGEINTWETCGVLLTEVRHAASKSVAEHQHEAPYFSLLLDGRYAERGEDFDLRYEPYTLVFHSAGTLHEDHIFEPCRFFAVDLLPRWESVIAGLGGARAHVFELTGGDPVWLVLRIFREFLARPDAAESTVEALVYELCAHVASRTLEEFREPAWLPAVDDVVRELFREPLDLARLASSIGVHPTHLCRAFRRFRGRTISEAMLGTRVQYVARRITESDESLTEIAAEAGFTDQSHMTRIFKRITGYPPGEHRRRLQTT